MNEDNKILTETIGEQRSFIRQKPLTLYDTHIKENFHIFGLASILYALLYVFCMYKNDAGITYVIFVGSTIAYIWFVFQKLEMKLKKESIFYIVSMLLLAVSTFCTDDWRIIVFNKTGVFLLAITMLLGAIYETKQWNLVKYLASIVQVCVMSIGEFGQPFNDALWYCKNKLDKKNSKYLYLLIGFAITIPLFVVVFLLLSSADVVFRDMADRILENISFGDICLMTLMFLFMMLLSYALMVYLSKKEIKEEVVDYRKLEPLIGIPVATVLTLLYLVFSGIQIMYLFLGKMQLPEGYTYAEYAREGFFQLLAVSILNLIIVLVGLYFFKPNKILKAVLMVMSFCTFIMIASSAMRMVIYIQYYYLTFLRILVLWSLLVLFLIFIGVICYIAKENFPLFRYSLVVFTCLYIGLSFSHPDYWIAKVNLASTESIRSDFFKGVAYEDYYYLGNLSADAAPVLVDWIEKEGYSLDCYKNGDMDFEIYCIQNKIPVSYDEFNVTNREIRCAYTYLQNLHENCYDRSFRQFNISRFIANYEVLK